MDSSDRDDRMGEKIKTHKKSLDQNLTPQNIPFRISEPQKFICRITWLGYVETITNLQIVLNTQKNPYLNQVDLWMLVSAEMNKWGFL